MKKEQLKYIKININKINSSNFKLNKKGIELFGSLTNLKRDLSIHFNKRIEKKGFKNQLINEFAKLSCTRNKIESIANKNLIRKVDLEKFFDLQIQNEVVSNIVKEDYIKNILKFIEKNSDSYKRDFVCVKDVCDVHIKMLESNKSGIYNVGTSNPISFEDVANIISEKYTAKIKYIDMPPEIEKQYQKYTCADLTKLNQVIDKEWMTVEEYVNNETHRSKI